MFESVSLVDAEYALIWNQPVITVNNVPTKYNTTYDDADISIFYKSLYKQSLKKRDRLGHYKIFSFDQTIDNN